MWFFTHTCNLPFKYIVCCLCLDSSQVVCTSILKGTVVLSFLNYSLAGTFWILYWCVNEYFEKCNFWQWVKSLCCSWSVETTCVFLTDFIPKLWLLQIRERPYKTNYWRRLSYQCYINLSVPPFTHAQAVHFDCEVRQLDVMLQSQMKVGRKVPAHQDGARRGSCPGSLTLVLRWIGQ